MKFETSHTLMQTLDFTAFLGFLEKSVREKIRTPDKSIYDISVKASFQQT